MLLFCGFVLQNPYYNLKHNILWWAFNVRASIFYQVAGVPLKKVHQAACPFSGNYPAIVYSYSGPGFD